VVFSGEGQPGAERVLELPGDVPLVLCYCPSTTSQSWQSISGGEDFFWMGSPDGELGRYDNESPLHKVQLKRGFWMGKYPVTQRQWEAVAKNNPSSHKWSGLDIPVESVSWHDVQAWLVKVNQTVGRRAGISLRLPSESEWEYACRAGTRSALNNGKDLTTIDGRCPHLNQVGWFYQNSCGETHPVGKLAPNRWGLYDMHGNVWEWCHDRYHGNYKGAPDDGRAWETPSDNCRVYRGGCCYGNAQDCRSANRNYVVPGNSFYGLGLRLAGSVD
jgi:formylglycine-generating enzyme required for sulfatase activity